MRHLIITLVAFVLSSGIAAASPPGFKDHIFNGNRPVTEQGVTTFHVGPGDCSKKDYGDGRGESDCSNGNLRSRLAANKHASPGQTWEYRMDIFVPADFRFNGGPNRWSLLEIAEWQRINTIKNHMHNLYLDSRRGMTFDDAVCFSPKAFGQWNRVVVRARWSGKNDGFLQVTCNDKVVYNKQDSQTLIPEHCGKPRTYQCVPELQEPSKPIQFQIGILFRGPSPSATYDVSDRKLPAGGITIQVRNLAVKRIK